MVREDFATRLGNEVERRTQIIVSRFCLLREALGGMRNDPKRVTQWVINNATALGNDWSAFTSSVFFATLPIGAVFWWGFLLFRVADTTFRDWFDSVFLHFQILTVVALFAILGVYAVRTWNRVRNLFSSPFEGYRPNFESGNANQDQDRSIEEQRKLKYRYWLWGIAINFVFTYIIFWAEERGTPIYELKFPYTFPDILTDMAGYLSLIWFLEWGSDIVSALTLGEGFGLFLAVLLPAGLIGYGIQLHIGHVKARDNFRLSNGMIELGKIIWLVLFLGASLSW